MFKSRLARLAIGIFGFALLGLALCPRPAAADSIVTYNFTGTIGNCTLPHSNFPCDIIPATSIVTGTYSIDYGLHEDTVVSWEFSTIFGTFSSPNGSGGFENSFPPAKLQFFFTLEGPGGVPQETIIDLEFTNPDLAFGPLSLSGSRFTHLFAPSPFQQVDFSFLSGDAVATPEPGSLLLLGTGLLGFAPLIRQHFRKKLKVGCMETAGGHTCLARRRQAEDGTHLAAPVGTMPPTRCCRDRCGDARHDAQKPAERLSDAA